MRLRVGVNWDDSPKSFKGSQYPVKLLMTHKCHHRKSPKEMLALNPDLNTSKLKRRGTIKVPGATSWATTGRVECETKV